MTYDDYIADRSGKDKNYFLTRAQYNKLSKTKSYSYLVNMGGKRKRSASNNGRPPAKRFRKGFDRKAGYYGGGSSGELKFHDVQFVDNTLAAGAVFVPTLGSFNLIAAGTGESERIGRKLTIKKILMRYTISLNENIDRGLNERMRVILYLDKQCNGAIATSTTILQTGDYQSFRNMENIGRYQVLMDRTHILQAICAGGNGTAIEVAKVVRQYSFYKNCNIPIEYSGTTGAITECRSNNIGMLLFCDGSEIASLELFLRLRFVG